MLQEDILPKNFGTNSFFWSLFRRILIRQYLPGKLFTRPLVDFLCTKTEKCISFFRSNAGKYGPEKLRIWTLSTQCEIMVLSEEYIRPCKTSTIEFFAEIDNGRQPLNIFVKCSFTDFLLGS